MLIENTIIEIFYCIAVLCVVKPFIVIAVYMKAATKAKKRSESDNIDRIMQSG